MIHRQIPLATLLATLVVISITTVPAFGQLVEEESVGRLTIGGGVGAAFPSLKAVNQNVGIVNPFLRRDEIRPLNRINEALLTNMEIRYRLGNTPKEEAEETVSFLDRISVGFSWGAITARTEINDVTRVGVRFYSRATTYYPFLLYHLPFLESSQPRIQLVVGGGPLFLRSGVVEWHVDDRTTNDFIVEGDISELAGFANASGSAQGFVVQGGGYFMLNSRFSVGMDVGYRSGTMSDLTLNDAVGQERRFPGDDDPDTPDIVRRLGDWSVIDFFFRDPDAVWDGRDRNDPGPDPADGDRRQGVVPVGIERDAEVPVGDGDRLGPKSI